MSGERLKAALMGLDSAINDLDATVSAAVSRLSAGNAAFDAGAVPSGLRDELSALKQMIATATALIEQAGSTDDTDGPSGGVRH